MTLIRLPASKIWGDPENRPESFFGEIIADELNLVKTESETDQSGIEAENLNRTKLNCRRQDLLSQCLKEIASDSNVMGGETRQYDPGKQFLNWLRENILNEKLLVDAPNTRIYIVPAGTFMVSTVIFKEFIWKTGTDIELEASSKAVPEVKIYTKTPDGLDVHKREANGVVLHGVVVPELR